MSEFVFCRMYAKHEHYATVLTIENAMSEQEREMVFKCRDRFNNHLSGVLFSDWIFFLLVKKKN